MISTKKFRGTVDYAFLYDDSSEEFKQALIDYQSVIKRKGTVEDMLKHVAASLHKQGGIQEIVEGVGYVQRKGTAEKDEKRKKLWSGIYVKVNDPAIFFYEL